MSLHFGKLASSLADWGFFGQTNYKLYLHTLLYFMPNTCDQVFLNLGQLRWKKKKKTSVIFNYRFCVNHYSVSFSALRSITRRRGREVPGSIASFPSRDSRPPIIKFHCTNTATASSAKKIVNLITGPGRRSERNQLKSTSSDQINRNQPLIEFM